MFTDRGLLLAVFFDADTLIKHPDVSYLFAWLALDRYSFMAVPEVPTSRSRSALNGHPIFNTGVLALRTQDPYVKILMTRWHQFSERASETLINPSSEKALKDEEFRPYSPTKEQRATLLPNDQFGLAMHLTMTHAIPELEGLSRIALPPRFNWRGHHGHGEVAEIVVDHSSKRKEEDMSTYRDLIWQRKPGESNIRYKRWRHGGAPGADQGVLRRMTRRHPDSKSLSDRALSAHNVGRDSGRSRALV